MDEYITEINRPCLCSAVPQVQFAQIWSEVLEWKARVLLLQPQRNYSPPFLQLPFCYISLAHFPELQIALGTSPSTSIVHMLVDCLLGSGSCSMLYMAMLKWYLLLIKRHTCLLCEHLQGSLLLQTLGFVSKGAGIGGHTSGIPSFGGRYHELIYQE